MRRILLVLLVATGHFAVSTALLVASFSATMDRLDTGRPPGLMGRMPGHAAAVLLFPIVDPLANLLPRSVKGGGFPWEHLIFFANSLLWAVVLVLLASRLRRRRMRVESSSRLMEGRSSG